MSKFKKMISGNQPVLVDFYATWCGPCQAMPPILKDVSKKVGSKARIVKVDIDKNPHAAASYKVRSVPTLLLFKDGVVKWRKSGVVSAKDLVNVIEQHS